MSSSPSQRLASWLFGLGAKLMALSSLLLLSLVLVQPGCAYREPGAYDRDDYFGGQGNLRRPNDHVPREVQRVDPWLPLF